jgi:thioredoxin 2
MKPESKVAQSSLESFLVCRDCGAKNRTARERLRQAPTCGRCHAALLPRTPIAITDATWQVEVDSSPLPVLVDFWAPWCGPCRAMGPILDQLAAETTGRLKVAKLNVDENPEAAARFGVQAIPTLVLLDGGKAREELRGAMSKAALHSRLAPHI